MRFQLGLLVAHAFGLATSQYLTDVVDPGDLVQRANGKPNGRNSPPLPPARPPRGDRARRPSSPGPSTPGPRGRPLNLDIKNAGRQEKARPRSKSVGDTSSLPLWTTPSTSLEAKGPGKLESKDETSGTTRLRIGHFRDFGPHVQKHPAGRTVVTKPDAGGTGTVLAAGERVRVRAQVRAGSRAKIAANGPGVIQGAITTNAGTTNQYMRLGREKIINLEGPTEVRGMVSNHGAGRGTISVGGKIYGEGVGSAGKIQLTSMNRIDKMPGRELAAGNADF